LENQNFENQNFLKFTELNNKNIPSGDLSKSLNSEVISVPFKNAERIEWPKKIFLSAKLKNKLPEMSLQYILSEKKFNY